TDTLYNSTTETFPIEIREIYGASASKKVMIKPGAGLNVNIAGGTTSALFRLNGTDYFTIDGSNNGTNSRNLLIRNLSTSTTSAVIWGYTNLLTDNPATFNVIKNTRVWGSGPSGTLACIGFGSGTIGITSTGKGNNNNTITNCEIRGASNGIYLGGSSIALKDQNNVISFNTINGTSPLNIGHRGIVTTFQNNLLIENNLIGNIINTSTASGISLGYTGTNTFAPAGGEVTNAIVRNNTIGPIACSGSASAFGICVTPATLGTDSIYNNLIAGIESLATPNDFTAGIYAGGGTGSVTRILHNTVSMSGLINGSTPNRYAIAIGAGDPVMDVRNNIFSNALSTLGSGKNFAIGLGSTTFTNLTLNYNAYFVSGALGQLAVSGGIGNVGTGTEYSTLNAFRAATGKDANSVNKAVTFVSATNAHLAGASIGDTSLRCLPILGITTDIDNELRNTIFTYMGADEIVSNPLPVKLLSFNAQALSTDAWVTWTTAAEVNNKGFELERSFDGKTFEFTQFIEGASNSNKINNYQYIDAGILAKTPIVYYRLKQVDYNGRFEYSETVMVSKPKTSSNEVVVYPNPTSGIISLLIETDVEENYEVTITNMNGKVVYNRQLLAQQGNNQITLPGSDELISGIYFVRVTGQQQTKVIKLVKTN
ncbi:MAG: T9SS C-terminal target domain-containing protein, partial [Bacteroidetes bacterium]